MSHSSGTVPTGIDRELPFVDRDEQLALLKSLYHQSVTHKGQVVFVAGEGGIGKTRLVRELSNYAKTLGAIFAVGSSYEGEGLAPYSSWIEVIRTIVLQSPPDAFSKTLSRTLAEVGRLVPELGAKAKALGVKGWLSGPGIGELIVSTDTERVRLFQSVADFLMQTSLRTPLVLFFDDVLWADTVSLQLLHYFCRRIREQRVLVLAAYRDVELQEDHPLSRLILDLNRERMLRRITLTRLTMEHVAMVISNYFGGGPVNPEFSKLIHSRTGGNPFFVEEILRSLSEDGRIYKSDTGWTLHEIGEVEIPSSVRALIKQRITRVGPEVSQALTVGAVTRMDFEYGLLREALGLEDEKLIPLLEKGVQAGFIRERRMGKEISYAFADDQIKDFLYDELSLIRRRKLHDKIASAMERFYERTIDQHLEELAYHHIQAGHTDKACEFSLKAGDRAARLHAQPDAVRHYVNVLDLLEAGDDRERLDVMEKVGDASYRMGNYKESIAYYREAVQLADHLEFNRKKAQILSKLGYVHWWLGGKREEALADYNEGLRAVKDERDSPEEAAISQNIARLLVNTAEVETGVKLCHTAIQIAGRLKDYEVLAHALQTLALGTRLDRESKPEVFSRLEDSLRISVDHGLEDPRVRAYTNLGTAQSVIKFDYHKAVEAYLKGIEYSRKVGFLAYEAWLEAALALHGYVPLGEWDKALEVGNHSLRIGSDLSELHTALPLIPLAAVNLYRGNLGRAEEYLTTAAPLGERVQYREIIYPCYLTLGKLYLERDDLTQAEEYLVKAVRAGLQLGWTTPPVEAYFELTRLCSRSGSMEKAHEHYAKLKTGAETLDEKGASGYERWAYGLLSLAQGSLAEASRAFRESSELWNLLKNPYNYARTKLEFGKASSENNGEVEAKKSVGEALAIFSRLGARLDTERVKETAGS